ncbi:hypothetical protein Tco_1296971, partial [Tanacetum coccineum]
GLKRMLAVYGLGSRFKDFRRFKITSHGLSCTGRDLGLAPACSVLHADADVDWHKRWYTSYTFDGYRVRHIGLSPSVVINISQQNTRTSMLIDQGPFELGTTRDTLRTTPEGGILLGPERPHTYEDLSDTEKKRYDADVRATNIVLQGLPKDIYKLINYNIEAKAIWDNVKMLLAGSIYTVVR